MSICSCIGAVQHMMALPLAGPFALYVFVIEN